MNRDNVLQGIKALLENLRKITKKEKINDKERNSLNSELKKINQSEIQTNSKKKYGWIFVAKNKSAIGYFNQTKIALFKEITYGNHSKHAAFNQSQKRFERLMDDAELTFYRRFSEVVNEVFFDDRDLYRIFLGIPKNLKENFQKNITLDPIISKKIQYIMDNNFERKEGIRLFMKQIIGIISSLKFA